VSFWVDDIALSGERAVAAIDPVIFAIQRHGHAVRRRKLKIMYRHEQQRVTGVIVNKGISAPRELRDRIRCEIASLAFRGGATEYEIHRLDGAIAHVSSLDRHQGARLLTLKRNLLQARGEPGARPPAESEVRACVGRCLAALQDREGHGEYHQPSA